MNNQKTVKSANSEKGAVLYIVTCALVVIQPLLDILSSIVINLGKVNYISVSGAVRAVIIVAGEDIDGLQHRIAREQHSAEEAADISLGLIL